jgi:hypothetical protein
VSAPLALHPRNPHYFIFRGKPTLLVTSGEHYGAVLNLDFDYKRYLRTLERDGLNLTRTFVGNYREPPGAFNITNNTLAPLPGRFISPWAESGGKFDLTKWNDAYFARLRDFVREASRRGIVVEVNLFCPFYEEAMWELSPMNSKNNVNGVGDVGRNEALTLKHPDLVAVHEELVRKIVFELQDFDNIYYEICNEPYFGGVTLDWQRHIAKTIADAEAPYRAHHLISQNIANGSKKIEDPDSRVSIFNFHYARPPEAVAQNYGLNKVIGCNETGFDGTADATYRIQGWEFLTGGGGLYNNLDYSFTAGHEDGSFAVPPNSPGGGSAALRTQLGILKRFFESVDFVAMSPQPGAIAAPPGDAAVRVLGESGRSYIVYLHRGRIEPEAKPKYQVDPAMKVSRFSLSLPAGNYSVEWLDTKNRRREHRYTLVHGGGPREFTSPEYSEDLAALISRR